MNDRVLVEALRAGDPDALAALYDAYAEGIYRYCWSLLPHSDSAQVALRDTLISAAAHAGSLSDPGRLRTWLYALAHAECLRRRLAAHRPAAGDSATGPVTGSATGPWTGPEAWPEALVPVAGPPVEELFAPGPPGPPGDPADADLRVMAANAVRDLPLADRAVLELTTRHGLTLPEVAAVLGVRPRQVEAAHAQARERLRDAITAEVLARKGPYDCARRARILTGFAGELTPEMRDQLVRHLPRCETCAPHRTRPVSEAKVFDLVPPVPLPDALRVRVLSCFADPELLPYRRYVARRSGGLGPDGFPVPGDRRPRRWPQAVAGTLAAVASMVAIAAVFHQFDGDLHRQGGGTPVALPATAEPPGARLPWGPAPGDPAVDVEPIVEPIVDSRATFPYGMFHSVTPVAPPPTAGAVPTQGSLPGTTAATHAPATPPSSPVRPPGTPGTPGGPVTPPGVPGTPGTPANPGNPGTPSNPGTPGTPGDPSDGGPREHQSHGPGATPCPPGHPTGKPTGKPAPTPVPAPTPPPAPTPVPTAEQPPTPSLTAAP
ncbi:hypothetical protein MTP10_06185 [Nonomuraea sp. 3-1Str]|uniref:RNA polymerase sigma factor n=1 Tax=Nonomuraea sp. 3-1Str TaxID=2929801 RepID=UPI002858AB9B|nr:sigma factor-like helix-turn-helix DNA-binding protein [Nonomuraea sp. 3-1Str]MDR8408320.1 hypothetical protein [Nonomuraea sp. 3-1Str]